MVQAMGQYGWTPDQVGKELGFSGADMLNHIYRYGGMGGGAGGAQAGLGRTDMNAGGSTSRRR